jgi:hypothetical protein
MTNITALKTGFANWAKQTSTPFSPETTEKINEVMHAAAKVAKGTHEFHYECDHSIEIMIRNGDISADYVDNIPFDKLYRGAI